MTPSIILIVLTLVTLILLTGNNIGTLRGPYRSLTQLRYISSILILAGVLIGTVIEGWKLSKFYTAYQLDINEVIILLFSATLLVVIGNIYKTPISLNMSIIAGVWGINIAAMKSFDIEYTIFLLAAWIILPLLGSLISAGLSYILIKMDVAKGWGSYSLEKGVSLAASFFLAYVFGANTLGLILSIVSPAIEVAYEGILLITIIIVAYLIGIKYFSGGLETGLGYKIYNIGLTSLISSQLATFFVIEGATQLGVPVSLTQVLTISLVGASLSRKLKLINIRYISRMSKVWIGSLILGFIFSISLYILFSFYLRV